MSATKTGHVQPILIRVVLDFGRVAVLRLAPEAKNPVKRSGPLPTDLAMMHVLAQAMSDRPRPPVAVVDIADAFGPADTALAFAGHVAPQRPFADLGPRRAPGMPGVRAGWRLHASAERTAGSRSVSARLIRATSSERWWRSV